MKALLEQLEGGDRRSIGRSNAVVAQVLRQPALFRTLFDGLHHDSAVVRMRAADALEKITARRPEWLAPYKPALLQLMAASKEQELRWHAAQMLPRLPLTSAERAMAVSILREYLKDKSSIVKTCAMQAMADLAQDDAHLRADTIVLLQEMTQTGTPAMKSRGRKLLKLLEAPRRR
jgi:hypothetical protein